MKRLNRWGIPVLMLLCLMLGGCRQTQTPPADETLDVYASFYPIYVLTQPLLEDVKDVRLHCLVQPQDGCLRAYKLSDWDAALLGGADAVLMGGRGLESFESLLYALGENGPAVLSVLDGANLLNVQAVNTDADTASHWLSDNPHIYMDVGGASEIMNRIASALTILCPQSADKIAENLQSAIRQLEQLDTEIASELSGLKNEHVIVMNEALVYAQDAYGLDVVLCYERESGADLTGADLENCIRSLENSTAKVILLEKQAPQSLCRALEAAGYSVAKLDLLSTGRAHEGFEGYLNAQRSNASTISNAFSAAK